jgi:ATP-binding cassette, subfamily F, member 3
VDNRLGVLFGERDRIEALFAEGTLAPPAMADEGKRLKTVSDEIEQLEARWLDLSTRIDELSA